MYILDIALPETPAEGGIVDPIIVISAVALLLIILAVVAVKVRKE